MKISLRSEAKMLLLVAVTVMVVLFFLAGVLLLLATVLIFLGEILRGISAGGISGGVISLIAGIISFYVGVKFGQLHNIIDRI